MEKTLGMTISDWRNIDPERQVRALAMLMSRWQRSYAGRDMSVATEMDGNAITITLTPLATIKEMEAAIKETMAA